jgi:hypothetical protein
MEIRDPQEFLRYFGKIHQRTMNVVGAIPPGKVDWGFGILEVAKGNRGSYHGCGKKSGRWSDRPRKEFGASLGAQHSELPNHPR